jgi:K+-transporting ATPase ATPase B chain
VCLIPTTIGALLAAIGIAGMDRALRANILAKSGKAVEAAGDVDTLLLDKTGTITIGNRRATQFVPINVLRPPIWGMAALACTPTRRRKARASWSFITIHLPKAERGVAASQFWKQPFLKALVSASSRPRLDERPT